MKGSTVGLSQQADEAEGSPTLEVHSWIAMKEVTLLDLPAVDLLERAIAGRGAFRRFKDTLFEFPELRDAWFRFRDTRMQRRAIEFLVDQGLVDEAEAERALADLHVPQLGDQSTVVDPRELAGAVAADLHRLYGETLV